VTVISGAGPTCIGGTRTLHNYTGGGTWSSSNTSIATIGSSSGVVTGVAAGTVTITYQLGSGCRATVVIAITTAAVPITGTSSVCTGSTTTLSDAGGGIWTSGATTIASVGLSTGIVTGIAAGTATITYSPGPGCTAATKTVTVNSSPLPINGPLSACAGILMTTGDPTPGGTWSSSNTAIATVGTSGFVTGVAGGSATITYLLTTGCKATANVTVNPLPAAISGTPAVCTGTTTLLTDATPGGTWSSSNTSVATAGPTTGIITGISAGTATITYSLGCRVMQTVTVSLSPGSISGTHHVCIGSTTTLSDAGGGSWSSSNTTLATVGATTGIVTGVAAGALTITYQLSTGCAAITTMTVDALPSAITGLSAICEGFTTALTDASPGGVWSSSNSTVAFVGSISGVVTGNSSGTILISYSVGGCAATTLFSVYPMPGAISGPASVCAGATATLADGTPLGTWSTSTSSVATINSLSGDYTGVSAGTATITYAMSTGCAVTTVVTINPLPAVIIGIPTVCAGLTTALTDFTPGGAWSSGSTSVATVSGGIVTGISTGTSLITYALSTGCMELTVVTVHPLPASISGTMAVCTGLTTTLSDATTGGTWSSGATTVATVAGGTGVVTGVSAGTAHITYTLSTGCLASSVATVNALPAITAAATGAACGDTYTLTAGGGATYSWAPSTGLSCSTCATATTSPAASITYTVTGTSAAGCINTATVALSGNRIFGHVTFSSYTPDTLDMKVWLIQYNPSDSSIHALDSMMACVVDSITYYEFDGHPSGNYLVKAQLLYDNAAGSSGYVPTYGLSSPHWDSATTIIHGSGSDSMHITMLNGTVPSGPGFISGYVYSGAGKGTGDAPVTGMIIFLETGSSQVLSHTYTDGNGYYSFSNLAYGDYIIYPEDYVFKTTHSAVITLNDATPTTNNIDFRQYLTSRIITPYSYPNRITPVSNNRGIAVYPNPSQGELNVQWNNQLRGTADVTVTNVVGHEVYRSVLNITTASGESNISLAGIQDGVYMITIRSANIHYTGKLLIQH
jgi:trimeric autotransporter adhesin